MRESSEKFIFQTIRFFRVSTGCSLSHEQLGQLFFCSFASGDVAHYLGERKQVALLVADLRQHAACEEPATVFANMPALVLGAPVHACAVELPGELTRGNILRRENDRGILTERFFFGPTEKSLRARIPAQDISAKVHLKQRIIVHTLYQEPESLFAGAQSINDRLLLRGRES